MLHRALRRQRISQVAPGGIRRTRSGGPGRRWTVGILAAILMASTVVAAPQAGATNAATFTGQVDSAGKTTSTHSLAVSTPGWVTITLDWQNTAAALNLGLKDPSGTAVKWVTGHRPEAITWDLSTTGNWTIVVVAKSGGSTGYTVTVADTAAPATTTCSADFCGTVDSTGVTAPKTKQYPVVFSSTGTATVVLNWSNSAAALNLGLKDPSGTAVKWAVGNDPEAISYPVSVTGTWTIVVTAKSGTSAFTISVAQPSQPSTGTVGGVLWVDSNGNGVDDSEAGLPAVTVNLVDASTGVVAEQAATGTDGRWSATVASGSSYRVRVALPSGYSYSPAGTAPAPSINSTIDSDTGYSRAFAISSGSSTTVNIGARPTGDVTANGQVDTTHSADLAVPVRSKAGLSVTVDWDESSSTAIAASLVNPSGTTVVSSPACSRPCTLTATTGSTGMFSVHVTSSAGSAYVLADASGAALQGAIAPTAAGQVGRSARAIMYPSGLDVGPDGTVYLADTGNDGVQAYNPDGSLKWKHLSWGHANGQFSEPRDVAYYNGKVYVADTGNNRIQVLSAADGSWITTWPTKYTAIMGISAGVDGTGNPVILGTDGSINVNVVHVHDPSTGQVLATVGSGFGSGAGQLNEPRDAATSSDGDIYVADFRNHRIAIFSPTGSWLGSFGSLGSGPGQFNGPYGVDLDDQNNIYVADSNNSRVEEFDPTHAYVASFGSAGTGPGQFFQLRRAVVADGSNPKIYAADLWADKITIFNADGSTNTELGTVRPPTGGFNKPFGMSMASDGTLYVADTTNQRIEVFDPTGTFSNSWGGRGFGDTVDGMNWPHDVARDPATGMIWVADTKNNRLTEYNSNGTEAGHRIGSLGTGPLKFHWPDAVTVVTGGDLIVADTWNNRVMRISPGSAQGSEVNDWTTTGFNHPKDVTVVGAVAYIADDGNKSITMVDVNTGAVLKKITDSSLHDPQGVTVDATGDVWVSDTSWNRFLDFTPAGALRQAVKPAGSGALYSPAKLIARRSGSGLQLYAIDTGHDRVAIYTIG